MRARRCRDAGIVPRHGQDVAGESSGRGVDSAPDEWGRAAGDQVRRDLQKGGHQEVCLRPGALFEDAAHRIVANLGGADQ